jgi:argininosuccinate lyase
MPAGSGALAGVNWDLDREGLASDLGFARPHPNSLDAVSNRDFALDYLYAASVCAMHLSRLGGEIVLWSSQEFGFCEPADSFASGSSIMPQKKNPDAAELLRGKAPRITASLMSLLGTMHGLPLAYSKDMQEDKEPLFDASDSIELCVAAMTGMVRDLKANPERMRAVASADYSVATDLADWLVREVGLPFRQAHHATGALVAAAAAKGVDLDKLTLAEMQAVEPGITRDVYKVLTAEASVAARKSFGGTAPANVARAVKDARKRFL